MKSFKNRLARVTATTYDGVGPLVFCVTVLILVAFIPHYVTDRLFELLASCFRALRGK